MRYATSRRDGPGPSGTVRRGDPAAVRQGAGPRGGSRAAVTALASGALVTVAAVGAAAVVAPRAPAAPVAREVVVLTAAATGLCLDLASTLGATGTPVVRTTCDATSLYQQWRLGGTGTGTGTALKNAGTGLCLAAAGTTTGSAFVAVTCTDVDGGGFGFDAVGRQFEIVDAGSGLCLAAPDDAGAGGGPVTAGACGHGAGTRWQVDVVARPADAAAQDASATARHERVDDLKDTVAALVAVGAVPAAHRGPPATGTSTTT